MKARLPKGMGGGNMADMLRQAQKMQQDAADLQEELEGREYTAVSGGGMVEVTTGMQNDKYVEILFGLKEGDVVYYTEQENIFSFFGGMGGMGGMSGGMPSMGGSSSNRGGSSMPGGMPSGMGGGMPSGMPSMNRGG